MGGKRKRRDGRKKERKRKGDEEGRRGRETRKGDEEGYDGKKARRDKGKYEGRWWMGREKGKEGKALYCAVL